MKNLFTDPYFQNIVGDYQQSLREVLILAIQHGIPTPALSSALAYFDSYRKETLPTNLIQAQRDYYGAHKYERIDKDGHFHTDWAKSLNSQNFTVVLLNVSPKGAYLSC